MAASLLPTLQINREATFLTLDSGFVYWISFAKGHLDFEHCPYLALSMILAVAAAI
jgi:hypothetical protein